MANIRATSDQHRRTAAQALAEQDQERLKGLSAEQLDNLSQTYTATLDNYKFTVAAKAWYLNSTTGASCSSSGGAGATYFKTISTVTWTNPGGVAQSLATDESVITPPAGGSILTQFHDQTTAPLPGVAVAASGPDADAATSDSNGCVIFSGLPTGNYNLAFTDAGYVDPNGNASPIADTANVASTGMGTPSRGNPIELGQAGGITANFGIDLTGTPAVGFLAPALAWYGSGGGYSMSNFRMNDPSGSSGSLSTKAVSGASGGLFPFASLNPTSYTNNYQLWAGTCRQEEPPAGTDAFTVMPGSTQPQPVTAPAIDVTVTYKQQNGTVTQVAPSDVKVSFASTSGTSCSETWGPFTTANAKQVLSNPITYRYAAPFASSATSGSNASASGQTGQITTVCADYTPGGGKYYQKSYAPTGGFTDQFGSATAVPTIQIQYSSTAPGPC